MKTESTGSTGPALCIGFLRKKQIRLFQSKTFYQAQVLLFTYLAYTAYHLSRRPLAVVKSVFHHQSCNIPVPGGTIITKQNLTSWCDWHRKCSFFFPFFLCDQIAPVTLALLS